MPIPESDILQRFIFVDSDVRGEIISLDASYRTALQHHVHTDAVQSLIGQFMAAVGLLSATLKFDGTITLQARGGDGPLALIMADCSHHHDLRAIGQLRDGIQPDAYDSIDDHDIRQLIGNGHLAVTIDPQQGSRYQGVVPLEQSRLDRCLEEYFERSEQLPTRLWITADGQRAAGLLLQALPLKMQSFAQRQETWERLTSLAHTVSAAEQLTLSHQQQLHRLFHQESVRLFTPQALRFACTCSRERTANMLANLGRGEIQSMLAENPTIEVTCQFCHFSYTFTRSDIDAVLLESGPVLH